MRIAFVVHNGVMHDARVLKEARTLSAAGHEVVVFGADPAGELHTTVDSDVAVHLTQRDASQQRTRMAAEGLRFTAENDVRTSFRIQADSLFELVKRTLRPDVVHIHDHVALNAAERYIDEWNVPIIWDAHEIYEDLAGVTDARAAVNPRIIRDSMTRVDHFITLNQSIADFYAKRYPALPPATLLPNAADYHRLQPYDGRLHDSACLPRTQKILLFQGGFGPHRGIPALLETASHLAGDWTVVFMGWGSLHDTIEEWSLAAGIHPNGSAKIASIPGVKHSELPQWTSGATLGAIPYEPVGLNHEYCTPNKLWEYPLAGVPIIATALKELKNYIDSHGIGITVDRALDPRAIADSVNRLNPAELKRMKRASLRFATTNNWATHESTLLDLYSSVERSLRRVSVL